MGLSTVTVSGRQRGRRPRAGGGDNPASLKEDIADVQTCTFGDLDPRDTWIGVSADPTFDASYYWDVEKQFDGAQLSPDGLSADLAYTLTARRSPDEYGKNFVIRGEAVFTALNPAPANRILTVLVPGVSRVTCAFDETGTNEITVPTGAKAFSPEYTCILLRKVNAQVVVGLYDGNDADAPALDAARTSYFFATPTTYERRTIEVWDKFESEAPSRKALVSSSFRSVSYVDRIQLTSLSRCESYVNTASIYVAGTNVTPPAPTPPPTPLDDDAEDVYFCPWTDLDPLEMQIALSQIGRAHV